ncbi:MAG TPA: efflux RND transporter permease subunit [Planctomycetaceae bacterium]|nr:efflux RND transporter permease subunit [Planctomycetaceae bacterium]
MLVTVGAGVACLLQVAPELVLGKSTHYRPALVIQVEASYPGANAATVAESVAVPVEQQVNGVENMLSMSSLCSDDGRYVLQVMFRERTDPSVAQVLVQNRVALADPVLPAAVQHGGMTVRKLPQQPIALVACTSPDNRYDSLYLHNYAVIQLKPELERLPGVAEVVVLGGSDPQMRITIDPDRLRAYGFSAKDVIELLSAPGCGIVGQRPGEGPAKPEEFENLILKATEEGEVLRLKDVARVELGSKASGATINGLPAVVMALYPLPGARPCEVSGGISGKLPELRSMAPNDLDIDVAFDFAPKMDPGSCPIHSAHLVIDADFPPAASATNNVVSLSQAADEMRNTPGVDKVVAVTEHPFALNRNQPCLIVQLSSSAEEREASQKLVGELRSRLQRIPDAAFRISVPSAKDGFPVYGFPIEFIVEDRGGEGQDMLLQQAQALVQNLQSGAEFTDVGLGLRMQPTMSIDIDRSRCVALGVEVGDVSQAVQLAQGSSAVNSINAFGRSWQVLVAADPQSRDQAAQLHALQVKNKEGQLVPLSSVATLRETNAPAAIERHNLYPAVRITANLVNGIGPQDGRMLCETEASMVLSPSFKLVWLNPTQR